jgi:hypothetical protein
MSEFMTTKELVAASKKAFERVFLVDTLAVGKSRLT